MTGIPILRSKLNMPKLPPAILASKRLQHLCGEMSERHSVIITAPAGYGKTVLMTTALNQFKSRGCRICWYRLDENDRDPAFFYAHLVEALFPEEEGFWEEARENFSSCGDVSTQYGYLNALICQELWAFHNLHPDRKTYIAFDDFHQIVDTVDIHATVQFLLDNLPDSFSVMISSRYETGLLTAKRRLEKDFLIINHSHLQFTEEETSFLIKKRYRTSPDPALVQKIIQNTEGWPAGIVLICQMPGDGTAGAMDSVPDWRGRKELLFQYTVSEVFHSVDDQILRFLVKVSLLPEFTGAEAAAIFDEENAPGLLERCHQRGLFLQKTVGADTTYRFHSLFREALQQVQSRYLSQEEIKSYHLKAAAFYIDRRIFDRAIEHFIHCGSVDLAVELVAREIINLMAFEASDQLRLWYRLLPDEVVHANGYLLYIKSYINIHNDPAGALRLLERALAVFRQTGDRTMQLYALFSISQIYSERNSVKELRQIQKQALLLSGEKQEGPAGWMLSVFDFAITVAEEKYAAGESLLSRLELLKLTDEWQWMVLFHSTNLYCFTGNLDLAESRILEAMEMSIIKKSELLMSIAKLFYALVLFLKDEQDPCLRVISEMIASGEKYDYKYILGFGKRLAALASYRRHDPESALDLLDASSGFFEEIGNTAMVSSNTLYRCLWLGQRRSVAEPPDTAQKALRDLTAAPSGMCLHESGLSVFGAIAAAAGDIGLAEKSLRSAVKRSKAKGAAQMTAGSCLHLAKLYYDGGNPSEGESCLRIAFDIAEENKYVMFPDIHLPTLAEMSLRCVKNGIHGDYALNLITRYYGSEAAEFVSSTVKLTEDAQLGEYAGTFLSRYGAGSGPPAQVIRVNLFERFSISVNGVTIPENEWKTKKIAGVLKYLLVHRNRPVSKDRLMDVFWPGVDKKLASMSLRAALYELKKVSRKYGLEAEGKASLLNDARDSLKVHAGNTLIVDADAFLAYYEEQKKLPADRVGREQKKIILEKMAALYQGDLLEEEIYEDWTFSEREELRSIYLGSIIELTDLCMADGDYSKAEKLLLKTLTMDQYNENACLRLLKLYIATSQRARAVKLHNSFTSRFRKDLGIAPDRKLSSFIKEQG